MFERLPAKKCRIIDVANAKFFSGSREEMKPSYVITEWGEKVSRVNLLGTVVEKFVAEDGSYLSLTVEDGSFAIHAKAFGEDVKILSGVEAGDFVNVVGRMKNYNGENYVVAEAVAKAGDPNFESLRRLEILKELITKKKIVDELRGLRDQMTEEEMKDYALQNYGMDEEILQVVFETHKKMIDYKPKVLELIEKLDAGEGVEMIKLVEFLNLPENVIESALNDLLASGSVYEPVVGRLKKV